MEPRRILFVEPYNWDCGPHRVLRGLITHLDRTRFIPVVALPAPCDIAEEFLQRGAEVRFIPGIRTIPRSISLTRQFGFWADTRSSAHDLENLIRAESIRLVHNNSEACWTGLFAARRAHVPAVCHLLGLSVLSPGVVGHIVTRTLNKYSHALIACSGPVKKAYMKGGAREDLLKEIHNGVDVALFDPTRAAPGLRSELGLLDTQPLVGMVANFDPRKGHHLFIEAAALVLQRIPQAHFVLVGNVHFKGGADYFDRVQRLVVKKGLMKTIHFLGFRPDLPDVLASLDVVVQPSLTEAGPLAPLEAMAMGRPVVATDVGGNSEEVIDGQTGIVVAAGSAEAIADAVTRLVSDPALAHQMGKAGRDRALGLYTEGVFAQEVQQLYDVLLGPGIEFKDGAGGRTLLADQEAIECKQK
ncbi:MAG: glycosyltransferase family 4 protein [Acidobacteriia bacterium]|nr:glycosyltransferase family 4 protein [Terriglobia bacterium]